MDNHIVEVIEQNELDMNKKGKRKRFPFNV